MTLSGGLGLRSWRRAISPVKVKKNAIRFCNNQWLITMANIDPSTLKKSISPWIEARHVLTDVLIVVIKSSYYIGVVVIIKKNLFTTHLRGSRHSFSYVLLSRVRGFYRRK